MPKDTSVPPVVTTGSLPKPIPPPIQNPPRPPMLVPTPPMIRPQIPRPSLDLMSSLGGMVLMNQAAAAAQNPGWWERELFSHYVSVTISSENVSYSRNIRLKLSFHNKLK